VTDRDWFADLQTLQSAVAAAKQQWNTACGLQITAAEAVRQAGVAMHAVLESPNDRAAFDSAVAAVRNARDDYARILAEVELADMSHQQAVAALKAFHVELSNWIHGDTDGTPL